MLVLTRKSEQSIRIGKDVIITVLECTNGHAKIGISAPKEIPVHREEIYKKIQDKNKESILSQNLPSNLLKSFSEKSNS